MWHNSVGYMYIVAQQHKLAQCKPWTLVTKMYYCGFIICNKRTSLAGDVDHRGQGQLCLSCGAEIMWDILESASQVYCVLQIALKSQVVEKLSR